VQKSKGADRREKREKRGCGISMPVTEQDCWSVQDDISTEERIKRRSREEREGSRQREQTGGSRQEGADRRGDRREEERGTSKPVTEQDCRSVQDDTTCTRV
jgi:hypothetical protein